MAYEMHALALGHKVPEGGCILYAIQPSSLYVLATKSNSAVIKMISLTSN